MIQTYGFVLPDALAHVAREIDRSRELLALADDWDEHGSPGYDEIVWNRAVRFLVDVTARLWAEHKVLADTAAVLPGPEGSIDLDWRTHGRELLVNVPRDPRSPATFYGDDGAGGRQVKGTLDTEVPNRWLLVWLAE